MLQQLLLVLLVVLAAVSYASGKTDGTKSSTPIVTTSFAALFSPSITTTTTTTTEFTSSPAIPVFTPSPTITVQGTYAMKVFVNRYLFATIMFYHRTSSECYSLHTRECCSWTVICAHL